MTLLKRNLNADNYRLFKVTFFIAISNALAMLCDIYGLRVDVNVTYLCIKVFFLLAPTAVTLINSNKKSLVHGTIAILYFFYSYYNTVYVNYSYYTAFIQFFFGCVFFLRYSVRGFVLSHITGIVLFTYAVTLQKSYLTASEYTQRAQIMNGAILPVFGVSILIFFYIKRKEELDRIKSVFFQKIGLDVGFILHEIKQPLMQIQSEYKGQSLEDLNELLETANIMWPGETLSSRVIINEVNIKEVINLTLQKYEEYLNLISVKIETITEDLVVNANRSFLKIVFKNIIKNAIEEFIENERDNYLRIEKLDDGSVSFTNSTRKKVNVKKVFDAGHSGKKSVSNRGLGLYISRELCQKMNVKLNAESTSKEFKITLSF